MNILRIILLLSLFIATQANASDWCDGLALQINGASKHLADGKQAKKEEFRGSNPGLGLVCQGDGSDWIVGGYKNSVYRDSAYVANSRYLRWGSQWHLDLGFAYGLATGYTEQKRIPNLGGGVGLLGFITASVGHTRYGKINVAWLPTVMVAVNLDIAIF